MTTVATVESLWRYPVKSMAGEELAEAFVGFSGVYGDRCYAFRDSAARGGFPYLNATAQQQMLLYRPRFRHPERAAAPPNLSEARAIAPGVTPTNAEPGDMDLEVLTPRGEVVSVDDPKLIEMLCEGLRGEHRVTLVRSDRALTDCRPVSLIGLQAVRQVEGEVGFPLDKRRFRANVYLDLAAGGGFGEDAWVGRRLRLGPQLIVAVLERDPRCKMISLDPETGRHDPEVLRGVAQAHEAYAGVYCAVLAEGVVAKGDPVEVLD
ncbi:MAG TPA: MOSC domain-containing protein [Pyrinomonadaceae bacterium]|nr:MOSC domain-containing protein [Pyrinomonadaceae bacterium]